MTNFRSRPLLSAVFVVVALICARLGMWQGSRLRERRAANTVASRARVAPPVALEDLAGDSSLTGRRVRAEGHYDHDHDIVIRGREYQGVPGVELVSPLIVRGKDAAVLVDRGFVPSPDAVSVVSDSFREPGPKEVEGLVFPVPSGQGKPLEREGRTTWARLDLAALQSRVPYRLYRFSILQTPESSWRRFPRRQDPPPLDDGPHLNYAIQWFAFAMIALVFAGVMARPERS